LDDELVAATDELLLDDGTLVAAVLELEGVELVTITTEDEVEELDPLKNSDWIKVANFWAQVRSQAAALFFGIVSSIILTKSL
jgi:pyruvate kinase